MFLDAPIKKHFNFFYMNIILNIFLDPSYTDRKQHRCDELI